MTEIFQRVVCGVDPSDAGVVAAALAARVAEPSGALALVSVDDPSLAVHAGWQMSAVAEELGREARVALADARATAASIHALEAQVLEGDPLHCLLGEIERRAATLVVVGTHGISRAAGIALGAVSTHLLHDAPCSVLVARAARGVERWPRAIAVGIDGSPESAHAAEAANRLGSRFGIPVHAVTAAGDPHVDLGEARRIAPRLEELRGRALDELHAVSEAVDLLVVGSRRLRGVRALRSVSERIAHEARSAVLVVRRPVAERT